MRKCFKNLPKYACRSTRRLTLPPVGAPPSLRRSKGATTDSSRKCLHRRMELFPSYRIRLQDLLRQSAFGLVWVWM